MKLYVATPMNGRPAAHYSLSMMQFAAAAQHHFDCKYSPVMNVSNLAEARCVMLHEAVDGRYDKLLFVDSDISFLPKQAFELIAAPGDVVAAAYRKKRPEVIHVGYRLEDVGRLREANGPLVGMACVGMGLTVIDLAFVKAKLLSPDFMQAKQIKTFQRKDVNGRIAGLFEFKVDRDAAGDERFLGEDEIYCRHVLDAGGKIWLHTGVMVGHVGEMVYQ